MVFSPHLELLIATANGGKVREFENILHDLPIRLRYLKEFPNISPIAESGESYEENAILKARAYAAETGLTSIADDSGLEVDTLDGAPGLQSARFGGVGASDQERIELLLDRLSTSENRKAQFVCVLAVVDGSAELLNVARGTCEGRIAYRPMGDNGFGFDPIFIPDGYESTFAELPADLKNRISHRAQALSATLEFFVVRLLCNLTGGSTGS